MKRARDFDDLDSIDEELERLRGLVRKAYEEGQSHADGMPWDISEARKALGQ